MQDIFYLELVGYIYTASGYIGLAGYTIFAGAVN